MKNSLLPIIFLIVTFVSCNKKDYNAEDLDFKASIMVENPQVHYKNSPIPMKLILSNSNENVLNDVVVGFVEGDGYITVEEKEYRAGSNFVPTKFDKAAIPFTYCPVSSGEQSLKFIVRTSKFERSSSLDLLVEEIYYNVKIENMPTSPKVGKKESFDIVINLANDDETGMKTCVATATINTGAGVIEYNGKALTTPVEMTLGRNTISYTPSAKGSNVIQLNLRADNGYNQPVYIPIDVGSPEFNIAIRKEENPSITAGKDYSFTLDLVEDGEDLNNAFFLSYRFISNGGVMKINNDNVDVGEAIEIKRGSNVIVYNGSEGGDAEIEFVVKDKYNSQKTTVADFNVAFGKIILKTIPLSSSIAQFGSSPLELIITQPGYKGQYSLSCVGVKGEAKITYKDNQYAMDGNWITGLSRNEILTISPLQAGDLEFRLRVKDSNGEISEISTMQYSVTSTLQPIIITGTSLIKGEAYSPASFDITMSELNYTKQFTIKAEMIAGAGDILYNSIPINSVSQILSGGTHSLSFVPKTSGISQFKVIVSDVFGQSEEIIYTVNVSSASVNIAAYFNYDPDNLKRYSERNAFGTMSGPYYEPGNLVLYVVSNKELMEDQRLSFDVTFQQGVKDINNNITFNKTVTDTYEVILKANQLNSEKITIAFLPRTYLYISPDYITQPMHRGKVIWGGTYCVTSNFSALVTSANSYDFKYTYYTMRGR